MVPICTDPLTSKNIHPVCLSFSNTSVFETERSLRTKEIIMHSKVVLGVTFSDDRLYNSYWPQCWLDSYQWHWWNPLSSSLDAVSETPWIKEGGHALHDPGRLRVPSLLSSSVHCRSGQPPPGLPPHVIGLCICWPLEISKSPPVSRLQKPLTLRRFCSSVFIISIF